MSTIRFVLNEPRNPQNIGVSARGMANFGFHDLSVVAPYEVAWKEIRSAVNATDVIENARKFKTLPAALKGVKLVLGTSAGSRRAKDGRWIDIDTARAMVLKAEKRKESVAVVFGSEKSGLSLADLSHCHAIVSFPTAPDCPSMNLGQAVTIFAYALREKVKVKKITLKKAMPVESLERLLIHGLKAAEVSGFLKAWDAAGAERRLRESFYRWNLSAVDIAMLHSLFRRVLNSR
jgi:tRNA/rRNA methyltransferase